ncbi:MAG: hypothetical protein ABJK37_05475 [Paraglaciecola sp.]|uniref:hypothetical protein n=1 Tax=Paraglaciecola sp. TaxID=1920173 RepID=UPI003297A47F
MISATNTGLKVENGYSLALVDKNGNVIRQGSNVNKEIFDALSAQVVKRVCSRFTAINEADFKKSA